MMSHSNKFLDGKVLTTTVGWFAIRQINHMDMAEQFIQIIHGSLMDNSIKEDIMDILE